jgi:hypothetical protein
LGFPIDILVGNYYYTPSDKQGEGRNPQKVSKVPTSSLGMPNTQASDRLYFLEKHKKQKTFFLFLTWNA